MRSPEWVERMNQWAKEGVPYLFVLDFKLNQPILIPLDKLVSGDSGAADFDIRYQIKANVVSKSNSEPITFLKSPIPFKEYQKGFDRAMSAIKAGDTYLINLCYATGLSETRTLSEIYEIAQAPYKLFVGDKFVVFSPEQFVSVEDGVIRTFPMKGTIDASLPDAEETLLADIKEREEHATVVDLLRNDLSIVSEQVTVDRYRFITKIKTGSKTLLQCSSEISGKLKEEYVIRPGSLMHALLPAGSITGAPKRRTVELINEIEPDLRNYFTGVFGVFDGKNLDSAVMIRMIEKRNDGFYYRSGGGLTYRSQAHQEYQEMIDKVYIPL